MTVSLRRLGGGLLVLLAGGLLLGACASGPVDVQTAEAVPLRLDRSDPEPLLRSVLFGYTEAGDPFDGGLVSGDGTDLTLHPQRLGADVRARLDDANGDGALDWDELAVFLEATYAEAHDLPPTLADAGLEAIADSAWFTVEVDGVMTSARRQIHVPLSALHSAMEAFAETGDLDYPAGTWIVGAHVVDGETVETTAKRRRADGFWDFAVYDAEGRLAPATETEPRSLRVPTQCTGCHLGQKLYEPEKSYPAPAADGPFGPRAIYVPEAVRSAEATALFQEHARRSDGVLGLYATVHAGALIAARDAGTISDADAALLDALGL
ncbi:MAG: hypothetical protein AAF845_05110 [Bacteroidota bacterium]